MGRTQLEIALAGLRGRKKKPKNYKLKKSNYSKVLKKSKKNKNIKFNYKNAILVSI